MRVLLILAVIAGLPSPASEARAAALDLYALPAADRPYVRYLTTYAVAPEARADAVKVQRFWVNSLSVRKRLAFPVAVGETLYRLDLRDYGWTADAWDKLAAKDVYFRQPWVDANSAEVLAYYSGSAYPLLRADFFVARTSIEPDYSRFLGLGGSVEAVKKQFGVQEADVKKLYLNSGGAVLQSIVAIHNRQLERYPTITGYFWESRDTKGNAGRQNVISGGDNLFAIKPDGGEFIWSLPNGLQGYYLANGDGKQVAEVPPDIARDTITAFASKSVVNARSCVVCHDAGLRPFNDVVSRLVKGDKLKLVDPDKERVIRLEEFYLTQLAKRIDRDSEQYADAVEACNGLKTQPNAKAFESLIYGYFEARVDLAAAARELGIEKIEAALQRSLNGTLTAILAGESVARDAWEEAYHEAAILSFGVKK